jgi:chaperonin cofactor prefoldin
MDNIEQYTQDLRKMLTKALARRKNILTYIRHVAPKDSNRAQVEKNLERYTIELDVLNAHIEGMQDEMKALKRQLSDKGVNFTLKEVKPVQPRKRPEKNPYVANGKMAFTIDGQVSEEEAQEKTPQEIEQIAADRAMAKAFKFIADLKKRGYKFHGKPGKSPIVRNVDFHGIQWCDTYEGKLFFYTTRRNVYRTYSASSK